MCAEHRRSARADLASSHNRHGESFSRDHRCTNGRRKIWGCLTHSRGFCGRRAKLRFREFYCYTHKKSRRRRRRPLGGTGFFHPPFFVRGRSTELISRVQLDVFGQPTQLVVREFFRVVADVIQARLPQRPEPEFNTFPVPPPLDRAGTVHDGRPQMSV